MGLHNGRLEFRHHLKDVYVGRRARGTAKPKVNVIDCAASGWLELYEVKEA